MPSPRKKADTGPSIEVAPINMGVIDFHIVGRRPMVFNAMSAKAMRDLYDPTPALSKNQRNTRPKHDSYAEFINSAEVTRDPSFPTFLHIPATKFKAALAGAALDQQGAKKAVIGRVAWVSSTLEDFPDRIPVYGIPHVRVDGVRNSGPDRTPDVRTRAILPEWTCSIRVEFMANVVNATSLVNLMANAGLSQGVNDWRPEKGSNTFGQFEVVNADDPRIKPLMLTAGRAAQLEAMDNPSAFNEESAQLFNWHQRRMVERGFAYTPVGAFDLVATDGMGLDLDVIPSATEVEPLLVGAGASGGNGKATKASSASAKGKG